MPSEQGWRRSCHVSPTWHHPLNRHPHHHPLMATHPHLPPPPPPPPAASPPALSSLTPHSLASTTSASSPPGHRVTQPEVCVTRQPTWHRSAATTAHRHPAQLRTHLTLAPPHTFTCSLIHPVVSCGPRGTRGMRSRSFGCHLSSPGIAPPAAAPPPPQPNPDPSHSGTSSHSSLLPHSSSGLVWSPRATGYAQPEVYVTLQPTLAPPGRRLTGAEGGWEALLTPRCTGLVPYLVPLQGTTLAVHPCQLPPSCEAATLHLSCVGWPDEGLQLTPRIPDSVANSSRCIAPGRGCRT